MRRRAVLARWGTHIWRRRKLLKEDVRRNELVNRTSFVSHL